MLGFAPAPATPLGRGHSAFELHYSIVNSFQASPAVEEYLQQTRGASRRPLDGADVAFILGLPEGQACYIDGESATRISVCTSPGSLCANVEAWEERPAPS